MPNEQRVIGIDLGTTNSVCAIVMGTDPEIVPNSEGSNQTPSVVAFLNEDETVVGEIARRQAATNPTKTVSSVKRLIGRTFDDVSEADEVYPFQIVDHDNELLIDIDGMGYKPEQISALILKKIKESAEAWLDDTVTQAVITVPAFFDDIQRQATIDAAELAGLEVLRLLNEPTAAAMAYGLGRSSTKDEIIAVYDFGGGTFDITILEISEKTFEVRTSTGDTQLGGDDLDDLVVNMIIDHFQDEHGIDLSEDLVVTRRLKEVAERAKCELSSTNKTQLSLPFLTQKDGQHLHLDFSLSREDFEDLIDEYVRRTIRCCKRALEEAGMSKKDIDKVILVGGTTRIPFVQEAVEDFFDQSPFMGVNPDEVVALGAATQAGIFEGMVQEVVLLDVTPHSLGIEVEGGKFSRIIEKNSTIPIKAAKTFTTTEANQTFVNIHVLQGEEGDAVENTSLGKFSLMDIPNEAAGVPRVRVTFFINADGVMEISAEEMSSNKEEVITIVHSQLSDEENDRRKRRKKRKQKRSKKDHRSPSRGTGVRSRAGDSNVADRSGSSTIRKQRDPGSLSGKTSNGDQSDSRYQSAYPATPPQTDDSQANEKPAFAVLGDASPGEMESGKGIRSRDQKEVSLNPVDYSKNPPMYSKMQTPPEQIFPTEGAAKVSEAEKEEILKSKEFSTKPTEEYDPGSGTNYELEKQDDPVPNYNRDIAGTSESEYRDQSGSGSNDESEHQTEKNFQVKDATLHDLNQREGFYADQTKYDDNFSGKPDDGSQVGSIVLPENVINAVTSIPEEAPWDTNSTIISEALDSLNSELYIRSNNYNVLRARCLLHMAMGQETECADLLKSLREKHRDNHGKEVLGIHTRCANRFSSSANILRHLAWMKEQMRDLNGACSDYERASKLDPKETDTEELRRLYQVLADREHDPQAQFKLVKILLKSNEVDDAIDILQELQHDDQFRSRALKVLGLCHWQKNMHFLAWQKFKELKIDDDIKDILYRLSGDMEASDQLANAVNVLEHLNEHAPAYRDAESRLKKLKYRLKLQKEEYESVRDIPVLSQDSRFTILEEINRGSMGIIFKANDKTLNEITALKMLNDYLCTDPSAVERFKSEARAAKKLSHPYIVRIHDLFEIENKRFISMEFIEGMDLKRLLIEKTTFTMDMVLYYMRQICDALSYAHRLGIVHRDIKPANVMVTTDNQIKITDFGIAKILRGDDVTKSGTAVIGTPLYMAPEQIIGDSIDNRTDIYALGIMLYEIVTGNPPFYLGNIEYHHIHTAPPALPESVPKELSEIILKMIEKEPGNRYQSIEDLLTDLAQFT